MPAHQFDELAAVFGFDLEFDNDHDLVHRIPFLRHFEASPAIARRRRKRRSFRWEIQMAYDALRTILPIAGSPGSACRSTL